MRRKILVVEDDPKWQRMLKMLCEEAFLELHHDEELKKLYLDDVFGSNDSFSVEVTANLDEAKELLATEIAKVDETSALRDDYFALVTVDLNLNGDIPGSAEGLELLGQLKNTSTVVVSGEDSTDYAIESLQQYGTLGFLRKGRFKDEEFKKVVRAAILYSDALKLLDTWQWHYGKKIQKIWDYIQQIPLVRKLSYRKNIQNELKERLDSITEIPNAIWVEKKLLSLLTQTDWALLSITIEGLERFSTIRSQKHASEVRKYMASILQDAIGTQGNLDDFIGCENGGFILISTPDKLAQLRQTIESRFNRKIYTFYDYKNLSPVKEKNYVSVKVGDQVQQEPFMTLAIGQVTYKEAPFDNLWDIADRAAEQKLKKD